jgi:hypothetical protein
VNTGNIKLVIKEDDFHTTKYGSVFGIIYFDVDGYLFPEYGWDDFVVIILSWWAKGLIELIFDKTKEIGMSFMDGSFKALIKFENENQCTINFVEGEKLDDEEEIIHKTIKVPFDSVKNEVINSCKKVLQIKDPKKMSFNDDYKNLEKSYNLLLKIS